MGINRWRTILKRELGTAIDFEKYEDVKYLSRNGKEEKPLGVWNEFGIYT